MVSFRLGYDVIHTIGQSEKPNMSTHSAIIRWERSGADFLKGRYSREHTWTFDGGVALSASAAPANVPAPYSNPLGVDPEEAFVASVSSCHMLTYLYVAYQKGFQVERYRDEAVGTMTKNERGVLWVSSITLRPQIEYTGERHPSLGEARELHHLAHEQCFIANSIRTVVSVI
jgi:organic hydroperoxide reductase OsmC/OhrA